MIKLYDEDAYMTEFDAEVLSCTEKDGEFCVILNKTAFFPTAGGQTCDNGVLGNADVVRVEIENDTVMHYVKTPFSTGEKVHGKIDRNARFRKMQHHSAEHIISGIVHSMFGFDNTGFHLSDKEVTMDYNGELSAEEVRRLENAANEAVCKNLMITAEYPPEEILSTLNYRAKLDLTENVRIVTIDGVDVCACCAPHVRRTGEIGIIKITDVMRHRGGVRMRMICGADALRDYQKKHDDVCALSALFSVKPEEVYDACVRKNDEIAELKRKLGEASRRIAVTKAEQIPPSDGVICVFEEDADMNILRNMLNICKEKSRVAAVFGGSDESGYNYIIASNTIPLKNFSAELNVKLNGRGGGRDDIIQGHFDKDSASIKACLEELF